MDEKQNQISLSADLRRRAEEKLSSDPSTYKEMLSSEYRERLFHELEVHQIELEMQNDELRHTQAALETSRERYFELYDLAPVGYFTISGKGLILETNLTAATLLGVTRDALVQRSLSRFIFPEDQKIYELQLKMLLEKFKQVAWEMRMLHADGFPFWTHINAVPGQNGECRITLNDITENKRAGEKIRYLLKEKEVMLKEIHHRVKNNMQLIYSLLSLQANSITDNKVCSMLKDSSNRVKSMAMVHEKLYQSEDLANIDFRNYLQNLVESIITTYERQEVVFSLDIEPVAFDVNICIPCGLIVNELVSNSIKHAFPDGRIGTIKVGMNKNKEGNYVLIVEDNGIGFPSNVDFKNTSSLGLQLVNVLTIQIHGTIELSREKGTRFTITIPG